MNNQNPGGMSAGPTGGLDLGSIGVRRRAAVSLSDLRTPLVENIMSMLPSGHDKAFKYALYNVLAMVLATGCVGAFWAAYCILEPFIKPLLWALLCGSVIHPFKDRLVTFIKEWLGLVKASSTPLSLQLPLIPFRAFDSVAESIGTQALCWWKHILVGFAGFFITYCIYYNPPVTLGLIIYWLVTFLLQCLLWVLSWVNGKIVVTVTAVYLGAILHFVYSRRTLKSPTEVDNTSTPPPTADQGDQHGSGNAVEAYPEKVMIRTFSIATWMSWLVYLCQLLPFPLLFIVFVSVVTGTAVYIRKRTGKLHSTVPALTKCAEMMGMIKRSGASSQGSRAVSRKASLQNIPFTRSRLNTQLATPTPSPGDPNYVHKFATPKESNITLAKGDTAGSVGRYTPSVEDFQSLPVPLTKKSEEKVDKGSGFEQELPSDLPLSPVQSTFSEDEVDGLLDSNKFLYGVLCACVVVQVWNRLDLLSLLPIPVGYFLVKRGSVSFGIADYLKNNFYQPFEDFFSEKDGPSHDFLPEPVRMLYHVMCEADRKFISVFESYLDMIATIVILVAVMVVSVLFFVFAATQFYAEGDHLVRVGANVINSTVSQYPEVSKLLPEGWESLTGSLIGNAYHYGRDYIKTMIRDSIAEKNPEKAEEMEKHLIELWDRVYLSWNRTWGSTEKMDEGAKGLEWNDIVKTGQNVTDWFDTTMMVNYAKSNLGGLTAILESLWTVLIQNVSLAISVITSILSLLFGGGTAILNLIISFIVFFTALFYLLSSSTSEYKPVELVQTMFPGEGKHSSRFVAAIEESVSGVFSATLKMSAFYGLWTWLIHTLFQVNIVFVPSFFAAIFAAVPLLMPYWAAFPAVLELWLIQGQWTKALLMLLAQMAPMSLVDAQIYSEIKGGGHPYLTALAVAGGIFYFGFPGAIMGPVVLCFVFVAVKVGSNYMKEGTNLDFQ